MFVPEITDPFALELPTKFQEFRPGQIQVLKQILDSKKKITIVQAPTGAGKTLIMAALQRLTNQKMLYLCSTIQLEEQVKNDFWYGELLKGRRNYETTFYEKEFPTINAGMCTRSKGPHCKWCCDREPAELKSKFCKGLNSCPYFTAKQRALTADLAILNMALFLNEANYIGGFSGRPWICIDEADTIEDHLLSFIELEITPRFISKLNIPPPARKTVQSAWTEWAETKARPKIVTRLNELKGNWGTADIQEEQALERMLNRLDFFLENVDETWVYSEEKNTRGGKSFVFRPTYVSKFAQDKIWQHGQRFLLMSATIISATQMCKDLGIERSDMQFIDLKSDFDPMRRPIYYIPSVAVSNKTKDTDWPILVRGLDKSLDKYKSQKVLVHTVSGALADFVKQKSKYSSRMITYGGKSGVKREDALKEFMDAKESKVLVSQSMDRGVDFYGDLCRINIILKVPYLNLGDAQVSKRVYGSRDGNMWYAVHTWRTLVQMCGRIVRSQEDWGITEIHDKQFGDRLWAKNKNLAPAWWREALRMPKRTS